MSPQSKLEMWGKAKHDSPVLELLVSTGEYGRMIRLFPVRKKCDTHAEFNGHLTCDLDVTVSALLQDYQKPRKLRPIAI